MREHYVLKREGSHLYVDIPKDGDYHECEFIFCGNVLGILSLHESG